MHVKTCIIKEDKSRAAHVLGVGTLNVERLFSTSQGLNPTRQMILRR
jgi:hypothetical protein